MATNTQSKDIRSKTTNKYPKRGEKQKPAKIIINIEAPEQCRIALIEDGILEAFDVESLSHSQARGNIYKGKLSNVEPSLQAIFVDIGLSRNAYLPFDEIHPEYYGYAEDKNNIPDLLKKGEEFIVQVVKEETPLKGAAVTTYLSLPSRYLVLMPGTDNIGISRKIEDEQERKRLKEILNSVNLPGGVGLIARTASQKVPKRDLQKDLRYLLRLWKELKRRARSLPTPSLIYQDRDLVTRFLRDHLTNDVKEILVDDQGIYNRIRSFLRLIAPRQVPSVKYYKAPEPIFSLYDIESQIDQIFQPRVELPSGGTIVIEPTEALVSIDVNSGKNIKERDLEETALKTNLEAAEEIARQLRLRDLGGIIVIDFIDMKGSFHRRQVDRQIRSCLKKDRARTEVSRISRFGLLEMVRQKIASPVALTSFRPCPYCNGRGMILSVESEGLAILREIRKSIALPNNMIIEQPSISNILVQASPPVTTYLLNQKREQLCEIERRFGNKIIIEPVQMEPGRHIVTKA